MLACYIASANCFAQSTRPGGVAEFGGQYPFVYYTPRDGLANSRVRSIKQDSKGRMYFLTYGGLSVHDGSRFINYTTQDGLANDVVNDVFEINSDSLLVATNTFKLNVLASGKINSFKTVDGFCPTVNRFHRSSDGHLYAATDQGLFILDKQRFIQVPTLVDNINVALFLENIIEYKDYLLLVPWSKEIKEKLVVYDKKKSQSNRCFYKRKNIWHGNRS
ncbi:MAG: hypothetical protein C4308_12425 [Chitinophagaceae bacterium]